MSSASQNSSVKIRAVVFDCDGLMFNTEEIFNLAGKTLLNRHGYEMTEQVLQQMMGKRAHDAFTAMIEMTGIQRTIPELQEESSKIFFDLLPERVQPMPGLFDLLDHIDQSNLPKGVATSSHREYLGDMLARFEITHRFDTTLAAEDVENGKPNPEIYLKAAKRLGVEPHEMLVLEDSSIGTQAGAASGAHIVSVPHQFSVKQDFSKAKHVASSLLDPYIMDLISN